MMGFGPNDGRRCIACAALKDLVQTLWDYLCKYPMRDDMYGDVVKVLRCFAGCFTSA